MGWRDRGIQVKTPEQVEGMRVAGLVVGRTLEMLRDVARPGLTTGELDQKAEHHIRQLGATPSFLGYHGFSGSICVSVNDQVVHGVPGPRVLAEGDVVSIDCGAIVAGWHGDAATTLALGEVSDEVRALIRVTEEAMWRGIAAAKTSGRVSDISFAVEQHVRAHGSYGILEDYTGHGIGTHFHSGLVVPHYDDPDYDDLIEVGMTFTIEPMLNLGTHEWEMWDDGWTVVTADKRRSAQFEHTLLVTADGAEVLTNP